MKKYSFYSRADSNCEVIGTCIALTRYGAAQHFAKKKRLNLRSFLVIYAVSR